MTRFTLALVVFHGLHAVADVGLLVHLGRERRLRGLVRATLTSLVAAGVLAFGLALPFHLRGFGVLGLLAAGLFVHLPLVLAVAAWRLRREARGASALALLGTVLVLAVWLEGFVIGPRALEVSYVTVETDELDAPLRIAVLADIQTDDVDEHERRAVRLALEQEPDLVVLPGDYVQLGDLERRRHTRRELNRVFVEEGLAAPHGVYAVEGNTDSPGWQSVFAGLDVHAFARTETLELDALRLTGLSMTDSFRPHLRVPPSPGRFHVVVGHAPDFALGDVEADLLIAGHCHGGQVRLPFFGPPITLSRVPRAWTEGAHEIRPGTTLVVSRGIGLEGGGAPRVRFLCRPEVVIVDVVPRTRP